MANAAAPLELPPVAGPIRRFTADMLDEWLFGRLEKMWPGHPEAYWRGRFLGFEQSNDYLAVRNNRAVLLAERKTQPITGKPMVWVVFCWSRDTADGAWLEVSKARPVIDLYNHCRRWLTDMQGERMLCGLCDDLRGDHIMRLWVVGKTTDGIPVVDVRPHARTAT
jgi:hypothetical protein